MRQIDNSTPEEREVLVLKGMLPERRLSAQLQPVAKPQNPCAPEVRKPKPMPKSVTLKIATNNAEKKHSRVFEATTDNDIVKSIYFLRPFADGVKEITLTVTRDIDKVVDNI